MGTLLFIRFSNGFLENRGLLSIAVRTVVPKGHGTSSLLG